MDSRRLAWLFSAAPCLAVALVGCTQDVQGNTNTFDPVTSGEPTSTTNVDTNSTTSGSDDTSTGSSSGEPGTSSSGEPGTTTGAATESSSGNFGSLCGNGTIEGTEECDCGDDGECSKADLNDLACADVDDPLVPGILTGGVLGCNPSSCRFDTSQCVYCGDGEINGNETCELDLPIETSCQELGKGTAGKLTCMKSCQVDTVACTECGYTFTFDECPGDWTTLVTTGAAPNPPSWACGNPGPYSQGPGVGKEGVWATNLDGPYLNNESGYLRSGLLDLSNCEDQTVSLTIRHWFNFVGGIQNRDGGVVQISTVPKPGIDGPEWVTIEPIAGALYQADVNAAHPPVDGNAAFSGNDPMEQEWVESTFDVTEYAGGDFWVRFVFGSSTATPQGGWYIDEVEVLGSGGSKK